MTAIDKFLKEKREELSRLRRERREENNRKNIDRLAVNDLETKIKSLESSIHRFRKSVMEPRKIEHLVINYKLFEKFNKKLKPFYTSIRLEPDKLVLEYGNRPGEHIGKLELYDLSKHFENYLEDIKKVELKL